MKKPSASKKSLSTAKTKPDSLSGLLTEVRQLIQSARRGVATVVDTFQVMTNFEIGRRIVEHEQKGAKRAAYGAELLKELSVRLTEEFGRGFSAVNLSHMRRFFLTWQDRAQIFQTASERLGGHMILQTLSEKSAVSEIPQTVSGQLVPNSIRQTPSGKSPFTLSWSHYVVLMTIKDPDERSFYEIESRQADWDVRELKRQKASCLYERLALSRDKAGIRKLAKEGQVIVRPEDLLKEPLVLEFLGLEEKSGYSENDLEQAIIDRLEHFLLELGKGFLFEARQKRFTFDEDHYFVDSCPVRYQLRQPKSETSAYLTGSIFYNRLLRCYVIIDLKLDKLTHQDIGPMQIDPVRYSKRALCPPPRTAVSHGVNPVRYVSLRHVPLRLCPAQRRRRKLLRRLHQRSETSFRRTRSGTRAFHPKSPASRTRVLRGMSQSGRRYQTGEIPQNRLGQALHQVASRRLSHGVHPMRCSPLKPSSHRMRLSHGVGVNYYDREVKLPEENPTIGLLLCKSAKKTVVELTLPKDANIHAKEYQLYLPSKELLKQKLDEWIAAASR
jgi:predicted nuclease of restriction endonuclease-like (RecB) superfamily